MAYRCVSLIPLVLSVMILIQGLFQLGLYTYFHHLAYSPSTPFFWTYSPLWAGGWNFVAGLSLVFVLSTGSQKQWGHVRLMALALFSTILVVQGLCWIMCELLEFRVWAVKWEPESEEADQRFVSAYVSSTLASVIGVTDASCGMIYVFVIFYQLAHIFAKELTPPKPLRTSTTRQRDYIRRISARTPETAPPALPSQASQTADSWRFVQFRSSTPKAKTEMFHRRRFGKGKRCIMDPDLKHRSVIEISDEEFQAAPLRAIAAIYPNAIRFDDLRSPSLDESFDVQHKIDKMGTDRSNRGRAMTSFFDEDTIQHVLENNNKRAANPAQITVGIEQANTYTIPSNAWRLPSMSTHRVTKALNFSDSEPDIRVNPDKKPNENPGRNRSSTLGSTSFVVKRM